MPIITNVHGLPQSIVAAVTNDPYKGGGDISATKLIDAPQVVMLSKQFAEHIKVDVSDRLWSLLGQAVHTILERAGLRAEGMVAEERLYATVNGWQLSGQFDVMALDTGTLMDYKVTTVYKAKGNEAWTRQLNILRWLAHQNGHDIKALQIIAIFRDWRKVEAERNADYPKAAIQAINTPMWDLADTEAYILDRVRRHQAAQQGTVTPCTDEERWYSGDRYALVKPGVKRALRVLTEPPPPHDIPAGYVVEHRLGEYKRCLHYCDVAPFCEQWEHTNSATTDD